MIRRILLFAVATGLIFGGSYLIFLSLEHPNIYVILRFGLGALFLVGLGSYVVWDDFIKPLLDRRTKK